MWEIFQFYTIMCTGCSDERMYNLTKQNVVALGVGGIRDIIHQFFKAECYI